MDKDGGVHDCFVSYEFSFGVWYVCDLRLELGNWLARTFSVQLFTIATTQIEE